MDTGLNERMIQFVLDLGKAIGLDLEVIAESLTDGTRIVISGDGSEILLRRKAAALDALQHVVNAAFRHDHPDRHIVVDCLDYRKNQDAELRETANILAKKAQETGLPQEIGPLNPYARRIVHLAVAENPSATSESVGDAFMKAVVITATE